MKVFLTETLICPRITYQDKIINSSLKKIRQAVNFMTLMKTSYPNNNWFEHDYLKR